MAVAHPSLFVPMTGAERATTLERYKAYLRDQDGELDYRGRKLSRREEAARKSGAQPVRWEGRVDLDGFHRNHASPKADASLDELTLWLLATAKANRSERYGVELGYAIGTTGTSDDRTLAYIETEEFYHTRILGDVVRCFGLEVELLPPSTAARMAIQSMVRLPKPMAMPVIFCAEIAGCIAFALLMKKGLELTASQPAVQRRVRELFGQILADELGHVAYCRAKMGKLGMAASRVMFDGLCDAMMGDVPEIAQLLGRQTVLDAIRRFDVAELASLCAHEPFWTEPLAAPAAAA